jgi:hypothetical protein
MFPTDFADKNANILCVLYIFRTMCGLRDGLMKLAVCTFPNLYLKRSKTVPNVRLSVLTVKKQDGITLPLDCVDIRHVFM